MQGGFDCWLFTVPADAGTRGKFVEVQTVNLSNTAGCGEFKMYLKAPDGTKSEKSTGWQPAAVLPSAVGQWKLFIKTTRPCRNYGLKIVARY